MPEPTHVYSPKQYSTVVDLWTRLLECAGDKSFGTEDLYTLILSDGDVDWRYAEKEVSLCYSSDHSGSDFDRANARALAAEFPFLRHLDNWGGMGESYVYLTIGELPSENTQAGIQELERLVRTMESLCDYPVLDEEVLSELAQDIEDEAWNVWFLSDLASTVAGNLGCGEFELEEDFKVSDEQLRELYYELSCDDSYSSFELESATSGYFIEWEETAAKMAEHIVTEWRKVIVDPNQLTLI